MIGLSEFADAIPGDLVTWLLRLLQRGSELPSMPTVPEIWPPIIPPTWRRWLSPGDEIEPRLERAVGTLAREAAREAYARARMQALDILVGGPCLTAATLFASTGHADAAVLLREFVNATGPQTRIFPVGSAFSLGLARSETTTPSITRALAMWKARPGGLHANRGVITGLSNTFVPVRPTIRVLPMPGPGMEVYGTPEAHVLGSFSYDGRLLTDEVVEWEARNVLSLRSYFADNWTKRVNIHLIDDNTRPDRYGNTAQTVRWQTSLSGEVLA